MKTVSKIITAAGLWLSLSHAAHGGITGQWSFEKGSLALSAKIGAPIEAFDADTFNNTAFGTTGQGAFASVASIGGTPVKIMKFPKTAAGGGFYVPTGANPNPENAGLVNQYTIIMDVLFPASSSGKKRALFQTDEGANPNGEFFVNSSDQIGTDGGTFGGNLTPDTWHRVVIAADMSATPPVIDRYIDGIKVSTGNPGGGLDGRFAIASLWFDTDDDDETEAGYLSSLQFRDEKIDDALVTVLGGATPEGIFSLPPTPYVRVLTPSPSTAIFPARSTVSPSPLLQAVIEDGATTLDATTVTMSLDGGVVTPISVDKVDTTTTVGYTVPAVLGSLTKHTVRVSFKDNHGTPLQVQWDFVVGQYNGLPANAAGAPGSANTPGLVVRSAQAPLDAGFLNRNTLGRAIQQLDGTLTDTNGDLVLNVATPGPNADGSTDVDLINFHVPSGSYGNFTDDLDFPGIPGSEGSRDNFADDAIAFLDLSAGVHRLGVSVATTRTDVNDDDSFTLFTGPDPRNILSQVVGSFDRGNVPAFADSFTMNEFTVIAPVAGVYPFRLVHWQGGSHASLEFYTVDLDTGDRILVNDPNDSRAVIAYRYSTAPFANRPYLAEVSPRPGGQGISSAAPIQALIIDDQTAVNATAGAVKLSLNGKAVVPTVTKAEGRTTVFYQPNVTRQEVTNKVELVYQDNGTPTPKLFTNTWEFTISVSAVGENNVTGQWDFNSCDLSATIGKPLQYFDGPNGATAAKTQFGTCTSLGVPLINGEDTKIMRVPGDTGPGSRNLAYIMDHGIKPNGGGTRVNQYTIIFDVMIDTTGAGAASMLQVTDPAVNQTDGDLFWQGSNFGQGGGGYNGTGAFTPGAWHRVIAAYDEAANPPVVTKYVDGIKQDDWTANQGLDNIRRAMLPTALLFADGDQDERRNWWVSSVQVRDGKLTDAQMAALGGPAASKIPVVIPATTVTGQWDFDQKNLAATVGKPLQYFDGPTGATAAGTKFGTCTELGVSLINGEEGRIMYVPGDTGPGSRNLAYIMDHGIKPNGGGTRVNQYTIIFDVMIGTSGAGAASMLQVTDPDVNQTDGDLFWQGSNFGQGGGGYNGTGAFTPGAWHRVIAAYDEAANPPVVTKYVDGIKQDDWTANQGLDNIRRAMLPTALLFADGDQDERREWWVNSVQVRSGKLSDAEMVALGGPSAKGIPVAIPASNVTGQWDFDRKNLAATVGKPLQYFDGPAGATAAGTQFGTCTELGVPLINGEDAKIMYVPGGTGAGSRNLAYIMDHGIKPNGGGTRVNVYTIIFDLMVGTSGPGAASMLQVTDPDVNQTDGDLFWQGSNFGQGGGGYNGTGAFTAGAWHRVIAAYNEAANPPVVTKYVDGIFQHDWTANQGLDNIRRAMLPTALLFADGDQDERREWWVNSIQIRSGALSKAEMEALGGPSASGIPVVVPRPVVAPEARLTLIHQGNNLRLSWPAAVSGYRLVGSPSLQNPNWQTVSGVVGNCVTVPISGNMQFFQLVNP